MAWILGFESTLFDLTYTWINGTILDTDLQQSNGTTGRIFAAPFPYDFASSTLDNGAIVSSFSENSKDLAETWSTIFSQTAIALSASVMSPHRNLFEQSRTSSLVARVPKVPLFTLLSLKLMYAIAGIILALLAMSSKPRSIRDVQARLNLAGWLQRALRVMGGATCRERVEDRGICSLSEMAPARKSASW
jgi:hypothetical protein